MILNPRRKKIPMILAFVMPFASLTVQARDSLEALRSDLNEAVTQINAQQTQIQELQTQVDALTQPPPLLYNIGDIGPAGGVVFYITDAGLHGLEAGVDDTLTSQWGCAGTSIPNTQNTAFGSGRLNTAQISNICMDDPIAARQAESYGLSNGLVNWYLPSKDELNLLYQQKAFVGLFSDAYYWSSSEKDSNNAWMQYFGNGEQHINSKNDLLRVRAIRAF